MFNMIDIAIIFIILLFGVTGLKNGVFKQVVVTVGTILVFVLSYYCKDFIANFLSYNLPFFNFAGPVEGLTSLNIIMYQMIAFVILFVLFSSVLAVIIKITGVFEKILKFTIVLGIPSKILGFIFGLLEGYVVVFIALFFLNQPIINVDMVNESKLMPKIVNSSPVLSNVVSDTNDAINEIYNLVSGYTINKDVDRFNKDSVDIMLKNKIISKEYCNKLIAKGKISSSISSVVNKY